MSGRKTSTPTLISALRVLAAEIECEDGVATMAIAEGADRIEELMGIIAAALKAAPVGHVPSHTAENLPAIVADMVAACREHSEEREVAEAKVAELEAERDAFCYQNFGVRQSMSETPWTEYCAGRVDKLRAEIEATRAVANEPAAHPDTEIIDWMDSSECYRWMIAWGSERGEELHKMRPWKIRDAVRHCIAARKGVQS